MENNLNNRKIAIFTDAHALLEPTQAALEDMYRRGITEIYSLGDNIGVGPNPSEVIDLLEDYSDMPDQTIQRFVNLSSSENSDLGKQLVLSKKPLPLFR